MNSEGVFLNNFNVSLAVMCVVRRLEGESYKMPAECDSMEISGQDLHTGPGMKLFQSFYRRSNSPL